MPLSVLSNSAELRPPLGLFPRRPTPGLYGCEAEVWRARQCRHRSQEGYLHWSLRFLVLRNDGRPREMAGIDVSRFLAQFAVGERPVLSRSAPKSSRHMPV